MVKEGKKINHKRKGNIKQVSTSLPKNRELMKKNPVNAAKSEMATFISTIEQHEHSALLI